MRVVCLSLALLLSACGPDVKDLPVLTKKLSSPVAAERNQAALQISRMGEAAKPATRALVALLRDPNGGVRTSAALALREIGTPEAIKALDSYQH